MMEHTDGHRQCLRERLIRGSHALADYEILELLLGHVLLRKDTKPLAKELVHQFGSLRGVLDARIQELMAVLGFGPALETYWILLREMMARYMESPARKRAEMCTPQSVPGWLEYDLPPVPAKNFGERIWIPRTGLSPGNG